MPKIEPYEIGVCSWSLQVKSIPELAGFVTRLGIRSVQIACGDHHHAAWDEGDAMPATAKAAGFRMTGAMLGFPGEDYSTPQTIERTGGFGDPATRDERLDVLKWGLQRTRDLGLEDLTLHAGFIPPLGDPCRKSFLDTLAKVSDLAKGIIIGFETGQERTALLARTLDDLRCRNLMVNFDPANMLLYDMDEPLKAIETLGPFIRSVHMKDARRPRKKGEWGEEVRLGDGQTNSAEVIRTLYSVGYRGPLVIEREAGTQQQRYDDIEYAIRFIRHAIFQ